MIYEIRTYNMKPRGVAEFEARFAEGYVAREKYSKLGGMWHTEIGPLNQVIHIWLYESLQHRADVRAAANKDSSGKWPPNTADTLISQESDILVPVSTMVDWTGPQELGNLYELRMYTFPPGVIGQVAERFAKALPARAAVYPVPGIFTSDLGNLNRLYQLHAYKDWAHREEVRAELREKKLWPPPGDGNNPIAQLVRHMIPASFSPLH
jgi:hypothetical protein